MADECQERCGPGQLDGRWCYSSRLWKPALSLSLSLSLALYCSIDYSRCVSFLVFFALVCVYVARLSELRATLKRPRFSSGRFCAPGCNFALPSNSSQPFPIRLLASASTAPPFLKPPLSLSLLLSSLYV